MKNFFQYLIYLLFLTLAVYWLFVNSGIMTQGEALISALLVLMFGFIDYRLQEIKHEVKK